MIWHSKEYIYLGPHQWNVNIRLGQLRHRVERIVLAHSQYHVLPQWPSLLDTLKLFWFGSHKTSWTGQQNPVYWPAVQIPLIVPIKYCINTRFLSFKTHVNVKRYKVNIAPITACLLGYKYIFCVLINVITIKYRLLKRLLQEVNISHWLYRNVFCKYVIY